MALESQSIHSNKQTCTKYCL